MSAETSLTLRLMSLVKFEHTVFALPFALMSAVVAASGLPDLKVLGWILLAMVGARTAAMTFNRIVDREIDRHNPRTAKRELVTGAVSMLQAWSLLVLSTLLFLFATYNLNSLALYLSPLALLIILGYSLTKRFTSFSHLFLGLALAIAPVGAWVAVKGEISPASLLLAGAVICWTAGFDIIYSLQDVDYDKRTGLNSIPVRLGKRGALMVSRLLHVCMVALLALFGSAAGMGLFYGIAAAIVAVFLVWEHSLVSPDDISKVNAAFFTANGTISFTLFALTFADVLFRGRM